MLAYLYGRAIALGILSFVVVCDAHASGFQLQEQTASGLGLAYSGMAAAAQDAGTVFWNPAALSALSHQPQVSGSTQYVMPSTTFNSTGSTYDTFGGGGNAGSSAVIPALYATTPLTPRSSFGIALNAPFGLGSEWHSQWAGMFYSVKSHSASLNINPVVSYRLNDFVSIGGGVSYQRFNATLISAISPLQPEAQARLDAHDWAWGWNAGLLFDLQQGTRLGATYRSGYSYTLRGQLSFNSTAFAALDSGAQAKLELPKTASLGIS